MVVALDAPEGSVADLPRPDVFPVVLDVRSGGPGAVGAGGLSDHGRGQPSVSITQTTASSSAAIIDPPPSSHLYPWRRQPPPATGCYRALLGHLQERVSGPCGGFARCW